MHMSDELHKSMKYRAVDEGITVKRLVEEALAIRLQVTSAQAAEIAGKLASREQ